MTISREPRKAQPHGNADKKREAWWYENAKSIDVYIRDEDGRTLACQISRRSLRAWLERTDAEGSE